MRTAVTRAVDPGLENCALTHIERAAIDIDRAIDEHRRYCATLQELGCRIVTLPAERDSPDAVFVEDAAVIFNDLAVIARSGQVSRRCETTSVESYLSRHRAIHRIRAPGTLDGGDVIRVDRTVFVGMSHRTNQAGLSHVRDILTPRGYEVRPVRVGGCLHLKTGCSHLGDDVCLINRTWIDAHAFTGMKLLDVDPAEPFAANALVIDSSVVHPSSFPRTRAILESAGFAVESIEVDEFAKAEAGPTCLSLIFDVPDRPMSD